MKRYTEEDKNGLYNVIEQDNGVKVRTLKKPSKSYRKKMDDRRKADIERMKEEKESSGKERLIKEKMRELAIKELEKEGKI